MSATIIELARRRTGDQIDEPSGKPKRCIFAPSYKALPFVTLKKEAERTGDYRDAETWWNDVPTDDRIADHRRGEACARMAVEAIAADKCIPRGLQLTFDHIFLDAVRRRENGGKYSRSLSPAARAFLGEIAKTINDYAVLAAMVRDHAARD